MFTSRRKYFLPKIELICTVSLKKLELLVQSFRLEKLKNLIQLGVEQEEITFGRVKETKFYQCYFVYCYMKNF